jgi:hypothetical protein
MTNESICVYEMWGQCQNSKPCFVESYNHKILAREARLIDEDHQASRLNGEAYPGVEDVEAEDLSDELEHSQRRELRLPAPPPHRALTPLWGQVGAPLRGHVGEPAHEREPPRQTRGGSRGTGGEVDREVTVGAVVAAAARLEARRRGFFREVERRGAYGVKPREWKSFTYQVCSPLHSF